MPKGSTAIALVRLVAYLTVTGIGILIQMAALALRSPARTRIPRAYHRICAWIFGFRIVVRGTPSMARPTLYVANHTSYLDIPVLGSLLPVSFVAKTEVGTWPLFGLLSRLQETVYVDRRREHAGQHRDGIEARLAAGDDLVLFPEGTSSDGNRVLPFKTALFAVAGIKVKQADGTLGALPVQPVSVAFTALDGIPAGRLLRPLYAWYGDMPMAPHLWQVMRLGAITVVVEFHDVLTVGAAGSRKALGQICEAAIAQGVARAIAGRGAEPIVATAQTDEALNEAA